jgi:hypothetical protein
MLKDGLFASSSIAAAALVAASAEGVVRSPKR